ncbi:hypothetical protein OAN38_01915 [Candidatus Marinimicrobia bacterium]|nr:hypothetical protein [Candidatus Neomarinimicrobiota bacterium]
MLRCDMLNEIEKTDIEAKDKNYLFEYEASEEYGKWIDFIFENFEFNVQNVRLVLGKENYQRFVVSELGAYYPSDCWQNLLEFLNDYNIDHFYFIDKCKELVHYTYSYSETGPTSWEYYTFYCKNKKELRSELLNFIIDDLKNEKLRGKLDPGYIFPPNEIKIVYPSKRKKKWNYYQDNYPRNLFCISNPTIFGNKIPGFMDLHIQFKTFEIYPFLKTDNLNDLDSFRKKYKADLNIIQFEIPSFDTFIQTLFNADNYTKTGQIKKSVWLQAQNKYLDDLLLEPTLEITKTTTSFCNNGNEGNLNFYWSQNCQKSSELLIRHLQWRNSLFNSLFATSPSESIEEYTFWRSMYLKDYKEFKDFPNSFKKFFDKYNWLTKK